MRNYVEKWTEVHYDAAKNQIVIRNFKRFQHGNPLMSELFLGSPEELKERGREDILQKAIGLAPELEPYGLQFTNPEEMNMGELKLTLSKIDSIPAVAALLKRDSRQEAAAYYIRRLDELHAVPADEPEAEEALEEDSDE